MNHKTEVEKLEKAQADFWRERFSDVTSRNRELEGKISNYVKALKQYEDARRFLQMSGDDPLDYSNGQ